MLDLKIPELVRKLQDKETVVFHCALSQQRGPSAALRYIRERERLLGKSQSGKGGIGDAMKKSKEEVDDNGQEEDEEWEDEADSNVDEGKKQQKIYVLDRGFVGWQERFGEDERLTEGYRKELWKDGYWM
jgi:Cdc25 family phosphatase